MLFFAVGASLVHAGDKKKEWKQTTWKTAKRQSDVISGINPSTGTISIHHEGGKIPVDRNLKHGASTEIFLDGKKVDVNSLKTGMLVAYTLGMDGETLARHENVVPPPAAPAPVATATPSFSTGNQKR